MSDQIRAPFSEAQIAALNAYQRSGRMHPFTCGGEHELHQTLIAEQDGWHCPDERCDYRQDWAHAWMADSNFLAAAERPGVAEHLAVWRAAEQAYGSPALTELAKVRGVLRVTEDEVGRLRELTAELGRKLAAEQDRTAALRVELRMLTSIRGNAPSEPPDGGDCEPAWERPSLSAPVFVDIHLPEPREETL